MTEFDEKMQILICYSHQPWGPMKAEEQGALGSVLRIAKTALTRVAELEAEADKQARTSVIIDRCAHAEQNFQTRQTEQARTRVAQMQGICKSYEIRVAELEAEVHVARGLLDDHKETTASAAKVLITQKMKINDLEAKLTDRTMLFQRILIAIEEGPESILRLIDTEFPEFKQTDQRGGGGSGELSEGPPFPDFTDPPDLSDV